MAEAVSIIGGTGALGYGLAIRLAAAGVPITIGSRDEQRARDAAARVQGAVPGARVEGLGNEQAADANEIVFLAIPFAHHADTLKALRGTMREGQLLVDTTVPLATAIGGKATRVLGLWQGSVAEQAQEMAADGVRVLSALHSVAAAHLSDLSHRFDEDTLVCGNSKADRERVAQLLTLIDGLRVLHGGPLEFSRYCEQLTPLLIGLNIRYKTSAGIRFTSI